VFSDGRGGGRIGTSNSQLDADGILDFLEDETFIGDQPGEPVGPSGEPRGRSAAEGRRERATGSRSAGPADPPADSVVRSLDSMRAKPRTLIPESFADAKLVADEFKRDIPVLLNLQGLERDLARRLIDFASGICYAMDGSMEKIASQVFLLIPESVQVSDEDRRRIEERGYAR
jgi:FtsZ-interacting cell division protein YlmF